MFWLQILCGGYYCRTHRVPTLLWHFPSPSYSFLLLHSYSSLGLELYNYDKICFDKNNFPGGKKRRRQKLGRTALVMRGALPAIQGCLHSTSLYKKSTWQKLRSGISILDYQPKQWINFRINSDQIKCQVSLATLSSLFRLIPNHSTWV